MVDQEKLLRKLRKLENSVRKLKEIGEVSREEYLQSEALQDRAERNFQLAAQACIDIAHHVIADHGWEVPKTYGHSFEILEKNGLLTWELAQAMRLIAGFRNILVHDYTEIDPDEVYRDFEHLADFERFAECAVKWLRKE